MSRRRSASHLALGVGIVVLIVGALFSWVFVQSALSPILPGDTSVKSFEVTRGETSAEIAAKLQAGGLIKSSLVFRAYVKLHNLGSRIQAGVYQVSPGQGVSEIAGDLTHGIADVKVTIP